MGRNHDPPQAKSTVDGKQIEYYSSFADKWWDPKCCFYILNTMNSLRVPFIRDCLIAKKRANVPLDTESPLQGIKILDVGCGGGYLCEALARLGAEVTGIDASDKLIAVAKYHAHLDATLKDNLAYIKVTTEEHVLDRREYYDAVVASEVIEHVSDQNFFVEKCVELTKPGGSIIMTTVTKTYTAWLAVLVAEYILNVVPIGTLDYNMCITPENLQEIFEKYGCQKKLVRGMICCPFLNKWYWFPKVLINYAIHFVKNLL